MRSCIIYTLYLLLADSQLYFEIIFHDRHKMSVQNKCTLNVHCTMYIVQRSHLIYIIYI